MDEPMIAWVESDTAYRRQLSDYLRANGLNIVEFADFDTLYNRIHDHDWAVFVVNPGIDLRQGLDFLKFVGGRHKCPVLVLSDGDTETERVVCLELGADDDILKTSAPREILARIRAAVRRQVSARPGDPVASLDGAPASPEAAMKAWRFARQQRELMAPGNRRIPLTSAEFNLLDVLTQNVGTPLSRDYLSRAVFGRAFSAMDRSIDNLVARLRRKLGDKARTSHMIKTARPTGYVFIGFPDAEA